MLIVDDDAEIHQITKLTLRDVNFQQHKLSFISVYSGAQAKELLEKNNDIALILLEVVMETDDAGLTLVRYIRGTLHNDLALLWCARCIER